MRWSNLTITADEQAQLPGYRDDAVIRRFDAPEALQTRFYEVRAKSALNRVPEASQVPFRWTINPYRGCSHACVYCTAGDTPILMADGSTRAMEDLRVGDAIIGTERDGRYRRYVETLVRDHWSTVKPAYRTVLEDGTELVTSGDHRFLTKHGWKHVADADLGQRPHLTVNNELLGTGAFAAAPEPTDDYRRGYLCGLIRGDGHLLALGDTEALDRARAFLDAAAVATQTFAFAAATDRRRAATAIRTQSRDNVERIGELIRWPLSPSDDWRKGFLAGIFDAEGSCGTEALRIPNTDPAILGWTGACLSHFGFRTVVEDPRKENGLKVVRLLGGLREKLRFFHLTDPAIRRKLSVAGTALKSDARTRVVSVEPLGTATRLYDITTGTGDFISNGVVSHNCFARPTHKYLDFDAGRDFEKEIVVKVNVPEVLRVELAKPSWKGEHIAMGTNTDPYQWVEGRYKLMRGIWEAMRDFRNPCSILTKSPLLLRDLDLMKEIAQVAPISANLSIPTIDEKAWRATEPHTPNPRARMEAVAELNRAGIPCGILVAPLMPGINDAPEQVEEILKLAAEAGATGIGGIALHLRGDVKQLFFDWLEDYKPELLPRYRELYAKGAYASKAERERLMNLVHFNERRAGTWPKDLRGVAQARKRGYADGPKRSPEIRAREFAEAKAAAKATLPLHEAEERAFTRVIEDASPPRARPRAQTHTKPAGTLDPQASLF